MSNNAFAATLTPAILTAPRGDINIICGCATIASRAVSRWTIATAAIGPAHSHQNHQNKESLSHFINQDYSFNNIYLKIMERQYGIQNHLQLFYNSHENSKRASSTILPKLKQLSQLAQHKKQNIKSLSSDQSKIYSQITKEQIESLVGYKQLIEQNQKILKVLKVRSQIQKYVQEYKVANSIFIFSERLQTKNKLFNNIYHLLSSFDEELTLILSQESNIQELKSKYFLQLGQYLTQTVLVRWKNQESSARLSEILSVLQLPLKKGKNLSENQIPQNYVQLLTEQLFDECCVFRWVKKVQMLTESQEQCNFSSFFKVFWHKIRKSMTYIFMNSENYKNEASAYQIDEPSWLFEYMEDVFHKNYECLLKIIENAPENIISAIKIYILHYNVDGFFKENIHKRFQTDLEQLQKMLKQETQTKSNIKFIIFNFLDELHEFQEKIASKYLIELNFVENVLLKYNESSLFSHKILESNFDYEHYWIQDHIFHDFYCIDYSKISNLKNVEAFNITINYIQLFDKLYSKFQRIKDQKLKNQINQFYQQSILQFVRHVKTSFERIYNNSGLDKYKIILSFKRVEEEFKSYFMGFIQSSSSFQAKIQEEYFSSLSQATNVYALEQLNSCHRKIIQKLTGFHEYFQNGKGLQPEKLKTKIQDIFNDWSEKMERINKIQIYGDPKIKNIFFTYLETTKFVFEGYELFIAVFEPFLKQIYTLEGMRMIRMLIEMDKGVFKEYISSHLQVVSFLSPSELKSIEKCVIN